MGHQVNYEALRFYLEILLVVLGFTHSVAIFVLHRIKASNAIETRVLILEEALKQCPTHRDVEALNTSMANLNGAIDTLRASLEGIKEVRDAQHETLSMVLKHLLEKGA